jgi:hydroxymethylglutaryl-CoA lyase
MTTDIKLIECPRDAWQGLKGQIPSDVKAAYLKALIAAGFKHIDAVSFVSPKAVPQMADSESVVTKLDPPKDVEIIGIVVNMKGAERAIATEAVTTLGFPYSVSPTFLQKNQNQSLEQSLEELEKIKIKADEEGLGVVAYISMAFGNPYGDLWNEEEVIEAVGLISDMDIRQVSLADTVGAADSATISALLKAVIGRHEKMEIGAHLHSRPDQAKAKILAALDAGCRRLDSAIGGLGGCPFAQDALVGNIPTERVLEALAERGIASPLNDTLDMAISQSADIAGEFGADD